MSGRKVFISYKYADSSVFPLNTNNHITTVRDYVNILEEALGDRGNIYKGEEDGNDLSEFVDETIESKLRDKIYDSSVTIVLISPEMKDHTPEKEQWIPWEISYSLKEHTRNDRTSHTNGILAVVLPDSNNSYSYYINNNTCCSSGCRILSTGKLFSILGKNMFNRKESKPEECKNNSLIYYGNASYIISVKWDDFFKDIDRYIEEAYELSNKIEEYNITKEI